MCVVGKYRGDELTPHKKILNGRQILNKNGGEASCGSLALCSRYADTRYTVLELLTDFFIGAIIETRKAKRSEVALSVLWPQAHRISGLNSCSAHSAYHT